MALPLVYHWPYLQDVTTVFSNGIPCQRETVTPTHKNMLSNVMTIGAQTKKQFYSQVLAVSEYWLWFHYSTPNFTN
jgi:hypothetical protein